MSLKFHVHLVKIILHRYVFVYLHKAGNLRLKRVIRNNIEVNFRLTRL